MQIDTNEVYDPICHLRTGSPWFDVLDSFMAFICAFAALPAADFSYSSCLQVVKKISHNWDQATSGLSYLYIKIIIQQEK
uniref:Uncharacterized protein n=1 Tax=Arundo donax TaxID=35708 RepID=A0A0A9DD90_ARUDO